MSCIQKATKDIMRKGAELLKSGIPISFPTDTVYALGAPVNDGICARKVYEIKQRPFIQALPILLADIREVDLVACDISDSARYLMQIFWPGALTLVLKKKPFVADIVTAGKTTVAVRIAAHPVAIELVRKVGIPLVGTSANIHGQASPVTAQQVYRQIGENIPLIMDAGKTPGGVESTIVDMSVDRPYITRQGAVSRQEIEKHCRIY